jgi:hypothetical protein
MPTSAASLPEIRKGVDCKELKIARFDWCLTASIAAHNTGGLAQDARAAFVEWT